MRVRYPKLSDKFEDKDCRKWFRCKELSQFERRRTSGTLSIKLVKTTKQMVRLLQATAEFSPVIWGYILASFLALAVAGCGGSSQQVKTGGGGSAQAVHKGKKTKSFVEAAELTEKKIQVKKAPIYIPGVDHAAQDAFRAGVQAVLATPPDFAKAESKFKEAIKKDPKFLEAYFNLGMLYEREGHQDEALRVYQSVMDANPNSLDAKAYIGKVYLAKAKKARKLGRTLQAQQMETKAMNLFDQVIAKNPDNVAAQNAIALYWLMKKNLKEAEKYVRAVLTLDPHNVVALNTRGLINYLSGNYRIARWLFEQKALKEDPNSTEAWNNLGLVYIKMKDVPRAVECFIKALKMNPSNSEAMMNLAAIYLNYLNYKGAMQLYKKVLAMDRENPEALVGMGTSLLGMHKPKDALKYYTEALKVKPSMVILYRKIGGLYESSLNDLTKAIRYYEKYIAAKHLGPKDELVMKVTALKQMQQMQAPKPATKPAPAQPGQPGGNAAPTQGTKKQSNGQAPKKGADVKGAAKGQKPATNPGGKTPRKEEKKAEGGKK